MGKRVIELNMLVTPREMRMINTGLGLAVVDTDKAADVDFVDQFNAMTACALHGEKSEGYNFASQRSQARL